MSIPVVILAGGLGTRLREETETKPKPMVEVGGRPILWHIMKLYTAFGFNEFVICLGYKGDLIKEFFLHYREKASGLTINMANGEIKCHDSGSCEEWTVHLLETGHETMTGGRVKRAAEFLGRRRFMLTYGDGVASVDIAKLLAFHEAQGRTATLTAVRPPARFGGLSIEGGMINRFEEKPQIGEGWINGGFMVMEPEIVNYLSADSTILEREPLDTLSKEGKLAAYCHDGFWQCMDTIRDLTYLRDLWEKNPPWKLW